MVESKFLIIASISCFIQVAVCGGDWCTFGFGDTSTSYCSNGCCYDDDSCCNDDSDDTGGSTIAGAVVGGVIFLVIVIACCVCCFKMMQCGQRSSTGISVRPHNGTTISNVYTSQQSSWNQPQQGYAQQGANTNGYPPQGSYTNGYPQQGANTSIYPQQGANINGYPQQGYPNQYPPQYPPPPPTYNDATNPLPPIPATIPTAPPMYNR